MVRKRLAASDPDSTPPIDLFEAIGGSPKCRELSTAFYARVGKDPTLRPLFPGKSHKCAIEAFAAFLAQFLGGPSAEARRRWWLSLRESHLRFQIGQKERHAWTELMTRALGDVEMSEPMRNALQDLFEEASAYVINTGPAVVAAKRRSELSDIHVQIRRRWEE
jgi:hemoglobin